MNNNKIYQIIREEIDNLFSLTIYHGDNYSTSYIDPRLMLQGNNQEGVGIYFSNKLETARHYGKNIVKTKVNMNSFVNSRDSARDIISLNNMIIFLKTAFKQHPEDAFLFMSDYTYATNVDDITEKSFRETAKTLMNDEIRNSQITLGDLLGIETFVKLWNDLFPNIHGTYIENQTGDYWFAIINTDYKLIKLNE